MPPVASTQAAMLPPAPAPTMTASWRSCPQLRRRHRGGPRPVRRGRRAAAADSRSSPRMRRRDCRRCRGRHSSPRRQARTGCGTRAVPRRRRGRCSCSAAERAAKLPARRGPARLGKAGQARGDRAGGSSLPALQRPRMKPSTPASQAEGMVVLGMMRSSTAQHRLVAEFTCRSHRAVLARRISGTRDRRASPAGSNDGRRHQRPVFHLGAAGEAGDGDRGVGGRCRCWSASRRRGGRSRWRGSG